MNTTTLPPFLCLGLAAAVSALVLMGSPGQAQSVYSCDFEPGSQGAAFTPGGVAGQGTPANGPWTAVEGATSPLTFAPSVPKQFYRAVQP